MLRQHLTSGIDAAHKYSPTDLTALGKEWDIDFDSARMGKRNVTGIEVASLEEEDEDVPDMTPVKDYTCGSCGYEPKGKAPWLGLRNHKCLVPSGTAPERSG